MNRRIVLPAAAAAVVAFGAGSLVPPAGADVARLTKSKVRSIAAKVVDQRAPTLRVASAAHADQATSASRADTATSATRAATADDAGKLGGQPPSAFRSVTYSVDSAALNSTSRGRGLVWTLDDVPAGSYLLAYDLTFDATPSAPITCTVGFSNQVRNEPSLAGSTSTTATVTGSGNITVPSGRKFQLGCGTSSGTLSIQAPNVRQSSITLTSVEDSRQTGVTTQVTP